MENAPAEPKTTSTLPIIPALSKVEGRHACTERSRSDGWTGERIAIFCETLAETAVVAEACAAAGMGISGAYAARRRNPLFAAAWDASLSIARERLADTLLARSMEGNVEQLYRDGELIGERHVLDNRLGLQILRRLDRLAREAQAVSARQLCPATGAVDWNSAIAALRTGDDEGVATALALFQGDKVEEVEGARNLPLSEDEEPFLDLSDRCWRDPMDAAVWITDFPPPAGFNGYESRPYDEDNERPYERACTEEEAAILNADIARACAAERREQEELRDQWFALLHAECSEAAA